MPANRIPSAMWWLALISAVSVFSSIEITARQEKPSQTRSVEVAYFDVPELPARVDEPKLRKSDQTLVLDCALANRSAERLLGIRLLLLIVDRSGKLRNRVSWSEMTEIPSYSIKPFTFHPIIKPELLKTDRLYLGIEEVTGRETIWYVAGAETPLRALALGLTVAMPEVRTTMNKFDRSPEAIAPLIRRY